jgi:hypothetical protein
MILQGLVAAGLCVTAFAGDDKMPKTVTGCLDKDATSGEYTITDSAGKAWPVTGSPDDMDKHAMRHTVKITGKHEEVDGKKTFRVVKIEHISDKCATTPTN